MNLPQEQSQEKGNRFTKTAAKVFLVILLLYIVGQLFAIYQTIYQLTSPVVSKDTIWEINKQFVFKAFIASIVSIIGLLLYFFKKYIVLIILVILTLVMTRFVLIKPWSDFDVLFF